MSRRKFKPEADMTLLTKFWRTKAVTIATSIAAMALVWGALAWPDWTSTNASSYDPDQAAWQWLASLSPAQRDMLIAVSNAPAAEGAPPSEPVAAEPPPVVVQHVTIVRHIPAGGTAQPPPRRSPAHRRPLRRPPPRRRRRSKFLRRSRSQRPPHRERWLRRRRPHRLQRPHRHRHRRQHRHRPGPGACDEDEGILIAATRRWVCV